MTKARTFANVIYDLFRCVSPPIYPADDRLFDSGSGSLTECQT